ncbi:MAG: hypothetical protein IJA15_03905 [Clostridia bacterium]|nr:hypothetical protein [Clostridia bacterium]
MNTFRMEEIERRLKRVEKALDRAGFSYYVMQKNGESEKSSQTFEFDFEVLNDTYLKLTAKNQSTASNLKIKIYLNDKVGYSGDVSGANGECSCILPFKKGEQKITLEYSADSSFFMTECSLESFGNIAYLDKECILSCINEEDRSLIFFVANGEAIVKQYKDGLLTTLYKKQDVKSGAFCKNGSNYLIVTVNSAGVGLVEEVTENMKVDYYKNFDTELISVCAFVGESPSVFAVRGNTVYRYDFSEMLFYKKKDSGYKGKKVSANPEVSGYIIITDYDGNSKLVAV